MWDVSSCNICAKLVLALDFLRQKYSHTYALLATFLRFVFAGHTLGLAPRDVPSGRASVRAREERWLHRGSSTVLVCACCSFRPGLLGVLSISALVARFVAGLAARGAGGLRRTLGHPVEQGAASHSCKRAYRCSFSAELVPHCA